MTSYLFIAGLVVEVVQFYLMAVRANPDLESRDLRPPSDVPPSSSRTPCVTRSPLRPPNGSVKLTRKSPSGPCKKEREVYLHQQYHPYMLPAYWLRPILKGSENFFHLNVYCIGPKYARFSNYGHLWSKFLNCF